MSEQKTTHKWHVYMVAWMLWGAGFGWCITGGKGDVVGGSLAQNVFGWAVLVPVFVFLAGYGIFYAVSWFVDNV